MFGFWPSILSFVFYLSPLIFCASFFPFCLLFNYLNIFKFNFNLSIDFLAIPLYITFLIVVLGTSLVVQWVRLHAPNAGGPGSIPGQGTRSHMP